MNTNLESLLADVLHEYSSLGIKEQLDYDKFYLYSIITHSTAIEGSTVTEIENQLLFDEGISSKKPMVEQLMNLDLKVAYERAFKLAAKHEPFSVELLCTLSSLVMKNTGSIYKNIIGEFSSAKGELRLVNVSAGRGGKSYMSWQKVPQKLQEFCTWLNEERNKLSKNYYSSVSESIKTTQIYNLSFLAHYNLVLIHPWADGNGRMSRLVMNMIQKEFALIPSIVKKENRAQYIQSLTDSQEKEDSSIFTDFMLNHHIENIKQQIDEYKSSLESDTSNLKNDTLNDTLKLSEKEQKILSLIKSKENITANEIVETLSIPRATVMRTIKRLKEKNLLTRDGAKKNGSWRIIK